MQAICGFFLNIHLFWLRKQVPRVTDVLVKVLRSNDKPMTFIEIRRQMPPEMHVFLTNMALHQLLRADGVYFQEDFKRFSLDRIDDSWNTLSEALERRYGPGKLIPSLAYYDQTPPIPFEVVKEYLLSKDLDAPSPLAVKGAFLATAPDLQIALSSYPRSGNAWTRTTFERLTGIVTGDTVKAGTGVDMKATYEQLLGNEKDGGFRGTSIVDQSIWMFKTHYPLVDPAESMNQKAGKALVIVRNPLDAITSFSQWFGTNSHCTSFADDNFHETFAREWKEFASRAAVLWVQYHQYWMKKMQTMQVLFVRFEDMKDDIGSVFTDALKFALNVETLEGTVIEKKIYEMSNNASAQTNYIPRSGTSNKNAFRFSEEILKVFVNTKGGPEIIDFFGYNDVFNVPTSGKPTFRDQNKEASLPKQGLMEGKGRDIVGGFTEAASWFARWDAACLKMGIKE